MSRRYISPELYAALIEALNKHHVAARAADEVDVSPSYAWRVARRENIDLVPNATHQRNRLKDPAYRAKQKPAASKGAKRWLKKQHANPAFRKKQSEASRAHLLRLNQNPEFRAASAQRLRELYDDPAFRAKQSDGARRAANKRHSKGPKPLPNSLPKS